MITVSFACNNPDNGLFLGKVAAIEIHGAVCSIELEGPHFPDPSNTFREVDLPPGSPDRCDRGFKLGHHTFPCYGYKSWYGNWCWDAVQMTDVDVLNLLRTLRDLKYRCTAGDANLAEAYDNGLELTPKLAQEALR